MKKNFIGIVMFVLLMVSCGPMVDTTKVSDVNLSSYKTFAYLPNSSINDKDLGYDDKTVGSEVVANVNRNLKDAGFTLDRENPDLLVLISTKTDVDTETVQEPVYASYPYAGTPAVVNPYYDPFYYTYYDSYNGVVGYDTETYKVKEGTLMVDLVDRKTKKVIWRGTASDEIYQANNSEVIAGYVDDIFDELPKIKRDQNSVADFE